MWLSVSIWANQYGISKICYEVENKKRVRHGEHFTIGMRTLFSQALFKLFVEGKPIYGLPEEYSVEIDPQEIKVFNLLLRADVDRQRKMWRPLFHKKANKEEFLKKLEQELPIWVLKRKLEGAKST